MSPAAKKQRTQPQYELLYHPGIPGRGEYIRLPLEAAGVSYTDTANEQKDGYGKVKAACDPKSTGDGEGNPPCFSPPMLKVPGGGKDGKNLVIHQTPNILGYLGPRIGMVPDDEADQVYVNQIVLTALDLSNEAHDTHHPVSVMDFYQNQKDVALKKAKDFRENRIPKFFSYFERILQHNEGEGKGQYLVGDKLTNADTTLWQVFDGLHYAYPNEIAARQDEFPLLFTRFYPSFREEKGIKEYLASDRRLPYSMGLYRNYPELDRQ